MESNLVVGILGMGLIGGSLAKALKAANRHVRIVAHDRQMDEVTRAVADHVVDVAASEPGEAFSDCGLVVYCTPVGAMRALTAQLLPHLPADCVLLDTGSTKQEVMALFADMGLSGRFVGGHPMAGSERSGYAASRANLFENAWFVLTPFPDLPDRLLQRVRQMVGLTGALPVEMPAALHDRATAHISHLPHVVATVLVNAVASAEDPSGNMRRLAAGGFKDLTRIASASPELWTGICLSNRDELEKAIVAMQDGLSDFLDNLRREDAGRLLSRFELGRAFRDGLSDIRAIRATGHVELTVDVEDKPGIIARISTVLARRDINIKNIGINNVREEDEGALLIRFESEEEGVRAAEALAQDGYGVRLRD